MAFPHDFGDSAEERKAVRKICGFGRVLKETLLYLDPALGGPLLSEYSSFV
jgi:hypothetical protein